MKNLHNIEFNTRSNNHIPLMNKDRFHDSRFSEESSPGSLHKDFIHGQILLINKYRFFGSSRVWGLQVSELQNTVK